MFKTDVKKRLTNFMIRHQNAILNSLILMFFIGLITALYFWF